MDEVEWARLAQPVGRLGGMWPAVEPKPGGTAVAGASGPVGWEVEAGALPGCVEAWIDLYEQRFPRTRPSGRRAIRALYGLLRDTPAGGFTVRDVAARAAVGLDTVARVVQHLRGLGVLSVDGGGWVAQPGGRPGHGVRYRYATHWPPRAAG